MNITFVTELENKTLKPRLKKKYANRITIYNYIPITC